MTENLTSNERRRSVFISYGYQDNEIARLLAGRLRSIGLDVWLDTDLEVGASWRDIVDSKLRTSDYFVILISRTSLHSEHFHNEVLRHGFFRELSDRSISVIPVVLDNVEVPTSLRSLLYLDFRDDVKAGVEKLVTLLAPTVDIDFSILSPVQFEQLIADLFVSLGYEVKHEASFGSRLFDFRLPFTRTDPFGSDFVEDWLIEVKHYSAGRVSAALVAKFAQLALVARDQDIRIALITSSQLTSAARELAQRSPLRLIEGVELKRILLSKPELIRKHFTANT